MSLYAPFPLPTVEGRKPDVGSFVIAVGDKKIVELRGMARPFSKMKALVMDDVIAQTLAALA